MPVEALEAVADGQCVEMRGSPISSEQVVKLLSNLGKLLILLEMVFNLIGRDTDPYPA